MKAIPFLKPRPPRLSTEVRALAEIEASGRFSNFGPKNTEFEHSLISKIFEGGGACVTVANATLGLMLSIRAQLPTHITPGSFALMPAYTFAATAHAAIWAGLTPLFCDIEPDNWLPSANSEEQLLQKYGSRVSVIVPYATFGACLDLGRYAELARRHSISVVIDAAASMGTLDRDARGFGAGAPFPVIFSLHATKTFATSEAGVVYSADRDLIERIRTMSNFGFGEPRHATMPGLNAKLSEVAALLGLLRLKDFDQIVNRRTLLYDRYRKNLPDFGFQTQTALRQAHQFVPALVPNGIAMRRDSIVTALVEAGIQTANYFSPHLAQQSYFRETCEIGPLPNTNAISARTLSLPLSDSISAEEIDYICKMLLFECQMQ
jgi:dTDP-4-amino-4,6-dideoxygalactose transaminase